MLDQIADNEALKEAFKSMGACNILFCLRCNTLGNTKEPTWLLPYPGIKNPWVRVTYCFY